MFRNWLTSQTAGRSEEERLRMVQEQLRSRGIRDERVLAAMAKVPREEFAESEGPKDAYGDHPLPIGEGQTVSQPYMVASMVQVLNLQPQDRVLEVGTGTGYEAAVLGKLAGEVWTIERYPQLAEQAEQILARLGYSNVHVVVGDGSLGLPEHAPYNKIVVAAAAPSVPQALLGATCRSRQPRHPDRHPDGAADSAPPQTRGRGHHHAA